MNIDEVIDIYSWKKIPGIDASFDYPNIHTLPLNNFVYIPLEQIDHFFKLCKTAPNRKFIVVSANSDFGLYLQSQAPVNADLYKRVNFIPWKEVIDSNDYLQIKLGPACDKERCNIKHCYSVKTYAHTVSTFDDVPPNVLHWFSTNVNICHPRITCIPMGIGDRKDYELMNQVKQEGIDRQHLLYVNFTNYTVQRLDLKEYYKRQPWASVSSTTELSKIDYYRELYRHFYVLCPAGNGLDCYRMWEALYCDALPIVDMFDWSVHLSDYFPIRGDLYRIAPELLINLIDKRQKFIDLIHQNGKLTLSYWYKKIFNELQHHNL
jgi:hypothetical protein